MRPTIPPVARLVVLGTYGTLLAVTGHRERILHAQRLQIAPGLQGALLAQHQVVFPAAALVAVTLDEELDRRILLEEVGVLRQVLHPLTGEGPPIEGKIDVREFALRRFPRLARRNLRRIGFAHQRRLALHRFLRRTLRETLQRRAAAPARLCRRTGSSLSLVRTFRGRHHVLLGTAAQDRKSVV